MARPFESDYLYGLHDPGGEQYMLNAGTPGWIVFTEGIGYDINNRSGGDYRAYSNRGLGVIVRLNNGYYPEGTIPNSRNYAAFAQRCANFVANSQGCKIWIIGNEMNYTIERPPAAAQAAGRSMAQAEAAPAEAPAQSTAATTSPDLWSRIVQMVRGLLGGAAPVTPPATTPAASAPDAPPVIVPPADDPYLQGLPQRFNAINNPEAAPRSAQAVAPAAVVNGQEVVTPALYAQCYRLCRQAIHSVAGHSDDQVLVGAVAPWNNQTVYTGNPTGDWVQYFADMLNLLGADGCDGFVLHTYTHQADPNLITSEARMNPPFANRRFEFRAYQDFMNAVPAAMRTLPVYITETNQDVVWLDRNIGWVQRAYGEINWWNQQAGNQKIRALVLYRYPPIDRWVIQGKGGVLEDFTMAMQQQYRWQSSTPATIAPGAIVATTDLVNLRATPGYVNQSSNDVLYQMPNGTELTVLSGPQNKDGLVWWQVRINRGARAGLTGWTAQATGGGQALLTVLQEPGGGGGSGGSSGDFAVGDTVQTNAVVRMRRTPGYLNKPATDVVADIPASTQLTVLAGPQTANGLTWWQLRSKAVASQQGWMAQQGPTGDALLTKVTGGGPTEPPSGTFKVGDNVVTGAVVRMRQTPGYTNKPATDVVADIAQGTTGTVLAGPRSADSLTWWQIRTTAPNGATVTGWMAETAPNGTTLLTKASGGGTPSPTTGLAVGDIVSAASSVRLRKSAGYANKPADDVLGDFLAAATLNLISGPRSADNLSWWQVGGILSSGQEAVGWAAQTAPNGVTLIAPPPTLPGTTIPNKAAKSYLGQPYQGSFGIAQLWGENPQIYSPITYDGVPLRGHNGIDFLTPTGTPILAVDNGVIEQVVYDDPTGFGHFVKVRHGWGEALYAHLSRIDVQVGQQVVRGNVLGATGATGFVFGPHLHFAIRINPYSRTDGWGGFSDPLPYMNPANLTLPSYVRAGATRSTAQAVAPPTAVDIARGPGYAPDQPGVARP
jgi:murein DD-endopeptidase MepM/ murein hydrolase activator NlpD